MNIEELIKEMPTRITREIKERCPHCGTEEKLKVRYELKFEVRRSYGMDYSRDVYLAYYECDKFLSDNAKRYIGDCFTGFSTLEEALKHLKEFL